MELAVGASEEAMKSLLGKLGSLLAQEYSLIRSVRAEIQYMNDELASMRAFLRALSTDHDAFDDQLREWMTQVRDVAYDLEDCVDDFSHRLGREPRGEGFISALRRARYIVTTLWERRDIAAKIGDLKNRAQHVGERRTRYGVNNPVTGYASAATAKPSGAAAHSYQATDRPQIAPQLMSTKEPVGMEKDIDNLGAWLTAGRNDVRVLAIVGFGGLGKTTLAMALHRKFGEQFDARASVQASQKLNLEGLLRSMLRQVMPQQEHKGGGASESAPGDGSEGWDQRQLKKKLEEHLDHKRCFILIDDIWSVSAWESIWASLPKNLKNLKGNSIVVTTRFKSVAEASCRNKTSHIQMLNRLPEETSKNLFFERIFGSTDPNPGKFKEAKAKILKKCGGLPLAIIVVAGILASNPDLESQWNKVCTDLSSELETNLTPEGVTQILNLCYNDLPADQKTCLLYLSIFPKGCSIDRKRLIRRWIAEGFICEKHGKTIEEVAEDYFNELISRNIVRPIDHNSNGKVKSCQVHDMILEYILSKSSEENFITVVGGHWLTPMPSNKVRRLSLHSSDREHARIAMESMNLSHVRSVTTFDNLNQLPSLSFRFGILQVLDLEGCKGLTSNHLDKICRMFHLKYLSLRKTHIKKFPSDIGRLQDLEMLDIRETDVQELPKSVIRLKRLVHLLAGNKFTRQALRLAEGISKMIALQTLLGIEILESSSEAIADMHNLTKLKKLSIYNLQGLANSNKKVQSYEDLISAIEYLSSCSLKTLAIDDGFVGFFDSVSSSFAPPKYIQALELSGKLYQLPQWIKELENLEKLTLSITSLTTDALKDLSKLPLLFSLMFSLNATAKQSTSSVLRILQKNTLDSGGEIFVPVGGFGKLKLLRFSAPVLPLLSFLEAAMPELEKLELRFGSLEGAYGVENLASLQQVLLRVSHKADEVAKVKVTDIKSSVTKHPKRPTVIVDEYFE